jgi:hypothetical protein
MGGGFIGGDSSVQWEIHGDNVGSNHRTHSHGHGGKGRRHKGVDQTDAGGSFTVILKLPAIPLPQPPQGCLGFTMPILPNLKDQIEVRWPSNTKAAPVKVSESTQAWLDSTKKKRKNPARKKKKQK